jgi:hypothetical protein
VRVRTSPFLHDDGLVHLVAHRQDVSLEKLWKIISTNEALRHARACGAGESRIVGPHAGHATCLSCLAREGVWF